MPLPTSNGINWTIEPAAGNRATLRLQRVDRSRAFRRTRARNAQHAPRSTQGSRLALNTRPKIRTRKAASHACQALHGNTQSPETGFLIFRTALGNHRTTPHRLWPFVHARTTPHKRTVPHKLFFPLLPTDAQKTLANTVERRYKVGNENTK